MAQDPGISEEEQNHSHPALRRCRKEVLFLYRYEQLERHLKNREVQEFLKSCGYDRFDVASVLARLRRRYQRYAGISKEFPHELGVLLGYPVGDAGLHRESVEKTA